MFCRKCGAQLKDAAKFCNKCGAPTAAAAQITKKTQPDAISKREAAPSFTPPRSESAKTMGSGVPVFTPPNSESSKTMGSGVPVFTPPNTDSAKVMGVPAFTPPDSKASKDIPLFEAPAECTECCCSHTNVPAVTYCESCGKPICEDCANDYQVSGEDIEFSDKPICFECARSVYEEDIEMHKSNLLKVYMQFGVTLLGMIAGLILWPPYGFIIGGALGSFFVTAIIEVLKIFGNIAVGVATGDGSVIGSIIGSVFKLVFVFVKSAVVTLIKLVKYGIYFGTTLHFKKRAEEELRALTEYYEYTLIRAKNQGVDLSVLMNNGTLTNNSFAQSVISVGEEQALQNINQIKISFNEFGEIVRNFDAA